MSTIDIMKKGVLSPQLYKNLNDQRLTIVKDIDINKINNDNNAYDDMHYIDEVAYILGRKRWVRRLYCKMKNKSFCGVGWIINEDVSNCMICAANFGYTLFRHHCRGCGNLVCGPCSPDKATIFELQELGEQRVCKQCYWGQEFVYARERGTGNLNDDFNVESYDPTVENFQYLHDKLNNDLYGRKGNNRDSVFEIVNPATMKVTPLKHKSPLQVSKANSNINSNNNSNKIGKSSNVLSTPSLQASSIPFLEASSSPSLSNSAPLQASITPSLRANSIPFLQVNTEVTFEEPEMEFIYEKEKIKPKEVSSPVIESLDQEDGELRGSLSQKIGDFSRKQQPLLKKTGGSFHKRNSASNNSSPIGIGSPLMTSPVASSPVPQIKATRQAAAKDFTTIIPSAGFVIKTTSLRSQKIFINTTYHDDCPKVIRKEGEPDSIFVFVGNITETTDLSGAISSCIYVIINTSFFIAYDSAAGESSKNIREKLCKHIIQQVCNNVGEEFVLDYKVPMIKNNFKASDTYKSPPEVSIPVGKDGIFVVNEYTANKFENAEIQEVHENGEVKRRKSSVANAKKIAQLASSSVPAPAPAQVARAPAPLQSKKSIASLAAPTNMQTEHLEAGERVVYSGLIGKRNPLGILLTRLLTLTDAPGLFYVDPKTGILKGEIDWEKGNIPKAVYVNDKIFNIISGGKDGRVYKMEDLNRKAMQWVDHINKTATSTALKLK